MRTRAVKVGDDWEVTGNKTWITHAARADVMTLLVRTDPATTDYRGLSLLLVKHVETPDGAERARQQRRCRRLVIVERHASVPRDRDLARAQPLNREPGGRARALELVHPTGRGIDDIRDRARLRGHFFRHAGRHPSGV